MTNALQIAIDIAGNQARLATLLQPAFPQVRQQHVSYWLRTRVPAEYVAAIEEATGVPRSSLRPDIYPAP